MAERETLLANAAATADLAAKLYVLQQLDAELHALVTRPLDEITQDDLDAILDKYGDVVGPDTRAAIEQLLQDVQEEHRRPARRAGEPPRGIRRTSGRRGRHGDGRRERDGLRARQPVGLLARIQRRAAGDDPRRSACRAPSTRATIPTTRMRAR